MVGNGFFCAPLYSDCGNVIRTKINRHGLLFFVICELQIFLNTSVALGGRLLGKIVQLVQEGLNVAVCKYLIGLDAENLAHGLIGVDGVALDGILELVGLDVGTERLGDIRGGHLTAIGLPQEGTERIAESNRRSEDRRALGNWSSSLSRNRPIAATTTTSLLKILGHTLLKAPEGLEARDCRITNGLKLGNKGLDILGYRGSRLGIGGRG
jgi:hypothetical protein